MPMLRAVRLLQSVEAGITNGTAFEAYLTDTGRLADFSVLLSMREQVRRMANSITTMDAIIASPIASNAVFGAANPDSKVAVQYMVKSPTAVSLVAASATTLTTVIGNATSWAEFTAGAYYENNILAIIHILAGITPATHATMTALVNNTQGSAALSSYDNAIRAAIESAPTMSLITQNANAMEDIISNISGLTIVLNNDAAMHLISNSSTALSQLNSASIALIMSIPSAVKIISSYPTAWTDIVSTSSGIAPSLEDNLLNLLVNLNDLSSSFSTVADILADSTAVTLIAENKASMEAITYVASAMTSLKASAHLSIVLNSTVAMSVLGPDDTVMSSLLDVPAAIAPMFASSVVKGYLVASTTLVDKLFATSSIVTYMESIAVQTLPTVFSNGQYATFQDFDTAPSKVLVMGGRGNNIGAIFHDYKFQGSVSSSGTGATNTIAIAGTPAANPQNQTFSGGFVGLQWTTDDAAVTAASLPNLLLVDMS